MDTRPESLTLIICVCPDCIFLRQLSNKKLNHVPCLDKHFFLRLSVSSIKKGKLFTTQQEINPLHHSIYIRTVQLLLPNVCFSGPPLQTFNRQGRLSGGHFTSKPFCAAATAASVFYFSKSSQGPSLGCLASRGGPVGYGLFGQSSLQHTKSCEF